MHVELIGPDPDAFRGFNRELSGWDAPAGAPVAPRVSDEARYSFIPPSDEAGPPAGGIGGGDGFEAHAISSVGVDDVGAVLADVRQLGGEVVLELQRNEGGGVVVGRFREPAGNLVGVAGPA